MPAIDVEEYLSDYGGRRQRGYGGLQWQMTCPWCNKKGDMYVALERHERSGGKTTHPGDFICFAGKCEKRGRFSMLYAQIEGIDPYEAKKKLAIEGLRERLPEKRRFKYTPLPPGAVASTVVQEVAPPPVDVAPEPKPVGEKVETALPSDFIPCWDGVAYEIPTYLKERGILKTTLRRYNIGFANNGEYAGRIILPVECPNGKSFTTRAIDPEAFLRYKAGHGAGRLLFGWQVAVPTDLLVVCEGPFDVLSIYQAGFQAVAIMGKSFRDEQVEMIRKAGAKKIVMMLDGDALRDAIRQAPMLGSRVTMAAPLTGKDANESTADDIARAIKSSVAVEKARVTSIKSNLAALKSRFSSK